MAHLGHRSVFGDFRPIFGKIARDVRVYGVSFDQMIDADDSARASIEVSGSAVRDRGFRRGDKTADERAQRIFLDQNGFVERRHFPTHESDFADQSECLFEYSDNLRRWRLTCTMIWMLEVNRGSERVLFKVLVNPVAWVMVLPLEASCLDQGESFFEVLVNYVALPSDGDDVFDAWGHDCTGRASRRRLSALDPYFCGFGRMFFRAVLEIPRFRQMQIWSVSYPTVQTVHCTRSSRLP
jgi:hypothetical protein